MLRCNADGYELTLDAPIHRPNGSGAEVRYVRGVEKVFLGKSCDARHKLFGNGKSCWANGGFWAEFPDHKFSFPRQELICPQEPDYYLNCGCWNLTGSRMTSRLATDYPTQSMGRVIDYEAIKKSAYHDQGIAIIDLTDSRIPWQDREIIEGACRRLYGNKRGSTA